MVASSRTTAERNLSECSNCFDIPWRESYALHVLGLVEDVMTMWWLSVVSVCKNLCILLALERLCLCWLWFHRYHIIV